MKKYTIIITVYNGEKYIKKCIDSIINQTIKDFKLIIIDDGSTDNTKDVIKPYLNDKNIEYYYKKNTGVADSRNYGISKVKTKYFLFVDSDDYIRNDLIETVDKYEDYDILSFKAIKVDENYNENEYLEKNTFELIDGKTYLIDLINNNSFFLVPWGYVYNTEYFKRNKFEYTKNYVHEDLGLTPIIILKSERIISIDYYGYYYYQSENSITRANNKEIIKYRNDCLIYQYDRLIEYVDKNCDDKEFKQIFKHFFSNILIWHGYKLNNHEYLPEYIKKIKKRKVINNIIIKGKRTYAKIILWKINYKLYYIIGDWYYKFETAINKRKVK